MVGRHFSGSWLTLPGNENKRGGKAMVRPPPSPGDAKAGGILLGS